MKKRKTYEISVINKTCSKSYSDQTKFYTSDTALELSFQLKEIEYDFDSAEIILLNVDDRSLVTRPVSKIAEGFTYELEDDIVAHYGEWQGQLKFTKGSEIYVSSLVGFRIENDLNNDRPPQMTEVNTWKNLRAIADKLIGDLRNELESVTKQVSEMEGAEASRQQAESERQNSELTRAENERQRNLTSIDEFIKLQDAVGGRNYITKNFNLYNTSGAYAYRKIAESGESVTFKLVDKQPNVPLPSYIRFGLTGNGYDFNGDGRWFDEKYTSGTHTKFNHFSFYPKREDVLKSITDKYYIKVEKGTQSTPYTEAPEDYAVVTKEDYYNHVKLMNEFKDSQFNQLRKAVIALGGTI